jgi:hypothetical protein
MGFVESLGIQTRADELQKRIWWTSTGPCVLGETDVKVKER